MINTTLWQRHDLAESSFFINNHSSPSYPSRLSLIYAAEMLLPTTTTTTKESRFHVSFFPLEYCGSVVSPCYCEIVYQFWSLKTEKCVKVKLNFLTQSFKQKWSLKKSTKHTQTPRSKFYLFKVSVPSVSRDDKYVLKSEKALKKPHRIWYVDNIPSKIL